MRENLVGVLSWFDEQPSMLSVAVTGLAQIVDHVVAVDGAYALFPQPRARSHPDQAETIMRTCEAASVGCTIVRPSDIWHGNEIEKRQFAADTCRPLKPDWLVVWDADYHLLHTDAESVRHTLANTDRNVATYTLLDNQDLLADPRLADHARRVSAVTEFTHRTRDILRWTDDLEWGPTHYHITGTYNGRREWVRGPDITPQGEEFIVPTEHLNNDLVAYHRRVERTKLRDQRATEYYQRRDQLGIEQYDTLQLLERP